jgi:hypothetical protein
VRRACAVFCLGLAGCFSARGGVESYHARIHEGMDRHEVRKTLGKPKDVLPIPGQGAAEDLPVEQWRFWWSYRTGRALTAIATLGVGLIWMDSHAYGFDVAFGRDGKVRGITEVAVPK